MTKEIQPLWNELDDLMKDRAEIKLKIGALESSEQQLKNQVENYAQLVDKVEKIETRN